MKTRKTFCYNCREKTTTIYGQDEKAKCWMCGSHKELAVSDKDTIEDLRTLKIIGIIAALSLITAIIIEYVL